MLRITSYLLAMLVLGPAMMPQLVAATLNPSLLPQVEAATFEVVAAKPAHDPLTYARPLPLDLIPYQQRTDKYYSIGTAFAIGPNRYVTAGHVLLTGLNSLWGPPALRDDSGHVYAIAKVEKVFAAQGFCRLLAGHSAGEIRHVASEYAPGSEPGYICRG